MLTLSQRPFGALDRACRPAACPHVAAVRSLRNAPAQHCLVPAGAAPRYAEAARRQVPPEIAAIRQDVPVKGKAKRSVALHIGYVGSNYRGMPRTLPFVTALCHKGVVGCELRA